MAIFALGIMPYISASIIMQLMTSIVPSLEALKKEGEQGRKVINQYTRYGTVMLRACSPTASPSASRARNVVTDPAVLPHHHRDHADRRHMFLMWLGEQITSRGIGNGISLIIFSGIVANLPHAWSAR
jgi:preprotein translocase subunit SecY